MNRLRLMRSRVQAMYRHDAGSRMESINQWDAGTAPRFYLGRTPDGNLWRFRNDCSDALVKEIKRLCRTEPAADDFTGKPRHADEYLRLLSQDAETQRVWTGPAFWFASESEPPAMPVAIDDTNAHLLRRGLEDWLPDVPHRQPFMALIEDGRAVSVCASVRISATAHEAGVETLPGYRQRGHAVTVVAGWAAAVQELGAIPFYSTSWDNVASRNVAARLELPLVGVDFHVT